MASRRAQIRQLYQSVPSSELSGTTLESLYSRCEANLAALDVWANKGNSMAMRRAGTGVIALSAWLADRPSSTAFQKASGLSPAQFSASEKELQPGIQIISKASSSSNRREGQAEGSGSAIAPSSDLLAKWAQDMKSGISPVKRNLSGPSTPRSNRILSDTSSPVTPSRSGLRDRSSIKEKHVFDPSPVATPTKVRKLSAASTPSSSPLKRAVTSQNTPQKDSSRLPSQSSSIINEDANRVKTNSHTTPIARFSRVARREPIYPVSLGFDVVGKDEERWSETKALRKIQRCIDALEKMKKDGKTDSWTTATPGELESVRIEFL
ncbi:hypothetical protein L7F22_043673 [Adiantum nelumboides]|nr:hypothetical protein [Adiantum nelumboides]